MRAEFFPEKPIQKELLEDFLITQKRRGLIRYALEVMKGDDEQKKILVWKDAAQIWLQEEFGVEDLSIIEKKYLLDITKLVLQEQQKQFTRVDELWDNGDEAGALVAENELFQNIEDEIAHRWFFEMYDIDVAEDKIPGGIIDNKIKEYIQRVRARSHLL